jgi:hypothetical protein
MFSPFFSLPEASFGRLQKSKNHHTCGVMAFFSFVGVAGFEPTTSSSRTKRATKLRYTPMPDG